MLQFFKDVKAIVFVWVLLTFLFTLVFFACTGKTEQKTVVSNVTSPEWSKNAVIYEVNIRQFTEEGTFNAFAEHLPRLSELGVDILWFMPITPIGELNRKGTLGSYYSVKDYRGINPEFGTMEDFQELVKKAHDLGMFVILDWVANHTAWDNYLVAQHPEWYTQDENGELVSPFDWSDVVQLNYEVPELRDYMVDAMKFWVTEANVDGFRCDVAEMVPTDFWNRARKELDEIKPVFMLAEAEVPEHHEYAFDMSYGWEFHHIMNSIGKGTMDVENIREYLKKEAGRFPFEAYRMHFITNHDENSWAATEFTRYGDGVETMAILTYTLPGMPLIYTGQEAGMDKMLEFFEKDEVDWSEIKYEDFYKTLNQLKKDNPALWNGKFGGELHLIGNSKPNEVFSFYRQKDENIITVLLNLSADIQNFTLNGNEFAGEYTNIFNGESVTLEANQEFEFEAWKYLVLLRK
jgi:cyclomaltodextrinase / maltogenic alpha-amylase / neopullulanase